MKIIVYILLLMVCVCSLNAQHYDLESIRLELFELGFDEESVEEMSFSLNRIKEASLTKKKIIAALREVDQLYEILDVAILNDFNKKNFNYDDSFTSEVLRYVYNLKTKHKQLLKSTAKIRLEQTNRFKFGGNLFMYSKGVRINGALKSNTRFGFYSKQMDYHQFNRFSQIKYAGYYFKSSFRGLKFVMGDLGYRFGKGLHFNNRTTRFSNSARSSSVLNQSSPIQARLTSSRTKYDRGIGIDYMFKNRLHSSFVYTFKSFKEGEDGRLIQSDEWQSAVPSALKYKRRVGVNLDFILNRNIQLGGSYFNKEEVGSSYSFNTCFNFNDMFIQYESAWVNQYLLQELGLKYSLKKSLIYAKFHQFNNQNSSSYSIPYYSGSSGEEFALDLGFKLKMNKKTAVYLKYQSITNIKEEVASYNDKSMQNLAFALTSRFQNSHKFTTELRSKSLEEYDGQEINKTEMWQFLIGLESRFNDRVNQRLNASMNYVKVRNEKWRQRLSFNYLIKIKLRSSLYIRYRNIYSINESSLAAGFYPFASASLIGDYINLSENLNAQQLEINYTVRQRLNIAISCLKVDYAREKLRRYTNKSVLSNGFTSINLHFVINY